MKFAALTLALLLAVGSQAASLPNDSPSQLQHMRSAMDVYINMWKTSMKNVIDRLDDTEYRQFKDTFNVRLDGVHEQLKEWQMTVAPMTDNLYNTVYEITSEFRASILNDIESLKTDLQSDRETLMSVLKQHTDYYHTKIEEIVTEFRPIQQAEMAKLKTRLEPIVEQFKVNAEETKTALIPIVNKIQSKIVARVENLKEVLGPYVQEYRERLRQIYSDAQSITAADIEALKREVDPLVAEVGEKLKLIYEKVSGAIMKH